MASASVGICPPLLLTLALVALVVALARPRTPQRETQVTRDGIAIMMVVDLSSSMDARDMVEEDRSINRLDVVKDVFVDFVLGSDRTAGRGRPDDLIGMVTFAGYADSICPLTLDHGNLVNIVKDLADCLAATGRWHGPGRRTGTGRRTIATQQGQVAHRDPADRRSDQRRSD